MIKRADSKLLSIWWFLVLIIIFVGIILASYIFFSEKYDIRKVEAGIIVESVEKCLIEFEEVETEILQEGLLEKCGLERTIFDGEKYYLKISLLKEGELVKEFIFGNRAFEKDCEVGEAMKQADNYPRCDHGELKVLSEGKTLTIKIKAGSNYESR